MDESDLQMDRLATEAFGYVFTHVPEHVRDDLGSLEREGAVYSDQWVEELGDFRHVRIGFTEEESKEFARRSWAYELWIRASMPQWARDTPDIDQDIASEADSYVSVLFELQGFFQSGVPLLYFFKTKKIKSKFLSKQ